MPSSTLLLTLWDKMERIRLSSHCATDCATNCATRSVRDRENGCFLGFFRGGRKKVGNLLSPTNLARFLFAASNVSCYAGRMSTPRILFVCLGNICRSPLAEAALRQAAEQAGLAVEVDSAGTEDYHVGEPPDLRSIDEAKSRGIDIRNYRGRQLKPQDFYEFDYIVGMDRSNMADIALVDPGDGKAKVAMLLDLVAGHEGRDVADPWYGGPERFQTTWRDVEAGAKALLAILIDERS